VEIRKAPPADLDQGAGLSDEHKGVPKRSRFQA
jgi:hypothetical protein